MTASSSPGIRAAADVAAVIVEGANRLGLDLSGTTVDQLVAYLHLISRWNATYNLTAVRDLRAMATQHVVDSLSVIPTLGGLLPVDRSRRVLDVGSGAGLPGVVVAIVEPDVEVLCVDSVGKKTAFITQVAASLALERLSARHARVESLRPPPRYDVVVSRAYASLADFVASTRHLLDDDGAWLAMKGKLPQEEMAAAADLGAHFEARTISVPGLDADRCFLIARNSSEQVLTTSKKQAGP